MTAEVLIGAKPVKMCGNAATSLRYKQIFGKDLLRSFYEMRNDLENSVDPDLVKQLAFIMAMQADAEDFKAITFDSYIEWLEGFEEGDLLESAGQITELWIKTGKTNAKSKKK